MNKLRAAAVSRGIAVVLVSLAAALPAAAQGSADADREKILRMSQEIVEAFNAGDVDAVLEFFVDDYIDLNHADPELSKSRLAAGLRQLFEQYDIALEIVPEAVIVHGEYAFARGELKQKFTSRSGGQELTEQRRYLEVLQKQPDGSWKSFWGIDAPHPGIVSP